MIQSEHIPLDVLEADIRRRGIDPESVLATKDLPGLEGLPQIVSSTEFLALQLRYGYQRAVALVRARIDMAALENSLRGSNPLPTALRASQVDLLAETFRQQATAAQEGAYRRGVQDGARQLRKVNVEIRFDHMDPHAATYARRASSRLITHINESQREAVRNLVETSVATGRTVQDIARDIRNVVGLRPDQVDSLGKFRERISQREGLSVDQIEGKVRRYADALLRQRGELIARTEVLSAANNGQVETWMEARRAGLIDQTFGKEWVVTPDELLCPICESLDNQVVGLTEQFESDEADAVAHPPAHPQCRCSLILSKMEG